MKRRWIAIPLIAVTIAALGGAGLAKDAPVASQWAAAPVRIDGLDQDWQGATFLTDPDSKAQYALRNDGQNLYILFLFKSPEAASTIDATGMKVYFSSEGAKSKDHGVHFLKKTLTADELVEYLQNQGQTLTDARKAELRQKKDFTVFEADVINPKKTPAPSDPSVKTEPPAFGTRSQNREVVYEFRIPLSRTNQPGGIGAGPGQTLKLGFDWGGLTTEMVQAMMGPGAGGPGRAPSLDGSVANVRNDEAREGGAVLRHSPRTRQHTFWIDLKLAAQ